MSQLLSVRGGRRLEGEVTIQGAKNSVLPILAATLLAMALAAVAEVPRGVTSPSTISFPTWNIPFSMPLGTPMRRIFLTN